jgi:hypothetical protein
MPDETEDERPLPAAAAAALSLGRIIDAIKLLREAEGLGLMQAKLRVEAYLRRNPALKAQLDEQQKQTRRRIIRWALVIDVIIIVAGLWWFFGR